MKKYDNEGTWQSRRIKVTNSNNNLRGVLPVELLSDETGPREVLHDGQRYTFTGRTGKRFETGQPVREMTTASRLWITEDGTQIWED